MFVCSRCHYNTNEKRNLLRHLNRKIECETKYDNQSRNTLIEQLQHREQKKFACACGASYNHISNFYRHRKTCTVTPPPSQAELMKKVADLEAQLMLRQQTHITNNNNITINNNNIVIIKNNFGAEQIDYLKDDHQFLQSCLSNRDVAPLIENIYCDKEHPENHTVRFRNVNQGIMEKFEQQQWTICDQDSLLTDLINRGYHILKVYARKHKDDVIENCCDDEEDDYYELMKWLQKDCYATKELKTAKKNLILVFRKNKTLLLGK